MKRYCIYSTTDGNTFADEDANGEYVKYEDVEQLETERERYREALELIVENYKAMSAWDNKLIIPNLRIANEALEGEK